MRASQSTGGERRRLRVEIADGTGAPGEAHIEKVQMEATWGPCKILILDPGQFHRPNALLREGS